MTFIFSMFLTSFIGFFICYRGLINLASTEKLFIPIFIGWGFFSSLINLFSTNFPEVELSGNVLFALIIISLLVFSIPTVVIDRRILIRNIQSLPVFKKELSLKLSSLTFYGIRSRYYLIIPAIFLALVLLNILITFYHDISMIDPIFQWVQRGELIFLEKSASGANSHPFNYYPQHVPILYAWAYFFDFDAIRLFHLIALLGFAFIAMENMYIYSRSRYASLVFTIMIVFAQLYYTNSCYPEGISNIYFFLAVLYGLRYLEQQNLIFIFLASFFMTMNANTRGEGLLYWGILLVFIMLISFLSKKFIIKHYFYWFLPLLFFYFIPKFKFSQSFSEGMIFLSVLFIFIMLISVLSEKIIIRIFYGFLPLCFIYYIFSHTGSNGPNAIVEVKIIAKSILVFVDNFGEIYLNKKIVHEYQSLMQEYHANKITAMILSFFAFWDSLFFDPEKTHFFNVIHLFTGLINHYMIEFYMLLFLLLWKDINSLGFIRKLIMLFVFPIACFIILMNFLQIYFYYNPPILLTIVDTGIQRYGGFSLICFIYFLSTSNYTKQLFNKIETNRWLAYVLNIPFLYILYLQV